MSFLDLADVIDMCAESFVIVRTKPGQWINGRYHQDAEPLHIKASGSVQPAKSEDLERLPEAARTREVVAIFTSCRLDIGGSELVAEEPDKVCYQGKLYEPHVEVRWQSVAGYYKYLCVRASQ